jgi:hypothetical protein
MGKWTPQQAKIELKEREKLNGSHELRDFEDST